jgi:hypothetical protein
LADQLSEYIVKLLDKVRGHDELEILLNKKGREFCEEQQHKLCCIRGHEFIRFLVVIFY